MYGQQPYQKKTFFDVAFKGWLRYVFIIGLVLIIIGPVVSGVLTSIKPADQFYSNADGTKGLKISDLAVQPVKISCSHTWKVTPSGTGYYTADSPSSIYYTVKIFNKNGNIVFNDSGNLELPMALTFYGYGTVGHTESSSVDADLNPGYYSLTVTSSQSLSCVVVQKYRYQEAIVAMVLISLIGVIVVALWIWLGLYTLKHTPLSTPVGAPVAQAPVQPPASQPSYYSRLYSSQGIAPAASPQPAYQVPAPSYQAPAAASYSYPPSSSNSSQKLISPNQPQNYDATKTNLDYRQGGYVMELVCSNCHRPVRSQPVYGVVTCESCGEKARVY